LRAVGLKPPTDVGAIIARAKDRLDLEQQAELRAVLVELDEVGGHANDGGSTRVQARRFLSLWRRISAILTALGDA
jgi:hypothetical protein